MTESEALAERRAKRFWISLVLMLLTIQLAIGVVAVVLATGDQSVAVVPNYHQAALSWDQTKRAAGAAERNGWKLSITVSDVADGRGMRAVVLDVLDSHKRAVDQLDIAGHVYHHALATKVEPIEFRSVGDGRYMTMAPMEQKGLWQIEVNVSGAVEPMTLSKTVEAG